MDGSGIKILLLLCLTFKDQLKIKFTEQNIFAIQRVSIVPTKKKRKIL